MSRQTVARRVLNVNHPLPCGKRLRAGLLSERRPSGRRASGTLRRKTTMRGRLWAVVVLTAAVTPALADDTPISWKVTTIEPKFRSEGAAVADVDKDGKSDILVGDSWYQAPDWTKHDIRKPGDFGDGLHSYSQCMCAGPTILTMMAGPIRSWSVSPVLRRTGMRIPKGPQAIGRSTKSGTVPATKRRFTSICSAMANASC